jgi:hypothetical protein
VLVSLRDALRRREIYVEGANRWRNPEDDLPGDFETSRDVHYRRMLPPLLAALRFRSDNTAYRPVIDALGLLALRACRRQARGRVNDSPSHKGAILRRSPRSAFWRPAWRSERVTTINVSRSGSSDSSATLPRRWGT